MITVGRNHRPSVALITRNFIKITAFSALRGQYFINFRARANSSAKANDK
jgi:hypothetical protein